MEEEVFMEAVLAEGGWLYVPRTSQAAQVVMQERERAYARSLSMFESLLRRWQLTEFRGNGTVTVRGSLGTPFRIRCRGDYLAYNILNMQAGERWCFYLAGGYFPLPDHWAAQLLTLVTNEPRAAFIAYKQPAGLIVDRQHGAI